MHDLLIQGGTLVDGTGSRARRADIAVDGDTVTAIGSEATGPARRTVDAEGHHVFPGWVDIHTHYDGQATWDPWLTPSSWHGVTTTVFGNCGVGFAPVRPGSEEYLINLMEGVEDIPGTVLAEGVDFRWETFPEYLDVLSEMPRVMDVGAQLPHGVLRFYVMGERGADHTIAPDEDEIRQMSALAEEALAAGALGITTSRTTKHRAADGSLTPGLTAGREELAGLADAMKRARTGVFECNTDFGPGEYEVLREVAERSGRPLSVLLLQADDAPERWKETLARIETSRRSGLDVHGQVGCRPIGILMGADTSLHPFVHHPLWQPLLSKRPEERRTALEDPDFRRRLVRERPDNGGTRFMERALERSFELGDPLDYEPEPSNSIRARAEAEGRSPWSLALNILRSDDGLMLYPFENYSDGSLEVIHTLLRSPSTICGLGDGGAHVATICDASYPTYLVSYWARDRIKGPRLPLEHLVRKQTRVTAEAWGLLDRGVIAPGFRADINVVDFDSLSLDRPRIVHDLPAGGRRLIQRSQGYRHTFVAGVEVQRDGVPTGERPGTVLRGRRPQPAALSVHGNGRESGTSPGFRS